MKYIITSFIFFWIAIMQLSGQIFHSGIGVNVTTAIKGGKAFSPMIHYHARVNLIEINDDLSISTSFIPALFFNTTADIQTSESNGVVYELPLMLDINFGSMATYDYETLIGGFISAGGGVTQLFRNEGKLIAYGPLARAGLRVEFIGSMIMSFWGGMLYNLKVDNTLPNDTSPNVLTIGITFHPGYN